MRPFSLYNNLLVLPAPMKLSVIMPVFNEQRTIREIIAKVQAVPIEKELIIVDDASTDGTCDILKEYEGKAIVGKVDVDSNPETAMKYGICNIPTILFIKGGQVVDKQVGAVPKASLVAMLNKHLS